MKGSQQRCVVPSILCKNIQLNWLLKNDAAIVEFVLDNFAFVTVVVHCATQLSSTLAWVYSVPNSEVCLEWRLFFIHLHAPVLYYYNKLH